MHIYAKIHLYKHIYTKIHVNYSRAYFPLFKKFIEGGTEDSLYYFEPRETRQILAFEAISESHY